MTTHAFQADVSRVLELVVHSLYSNRDIFLRELISNGADALDKLRFAALGNDALYAGDSDLAIRITPNEEEKTLVIEDNGVGMSAEELAKNLGTIAHSGTKELIERLAKEGKSGKPDLIGQFGVGFYSAFLVADRVVVESRPAGEAGANRWSSNGRDGYSLEACEKEGRGTKITLHLKEDAAEYLDDYRLRTLVKTWSDFVAHPIRLVTEDEKEGVKLEQINQATALWTRSKSDVTEEQYKAFYQNLTNDYEAPLATLHARVEGTWEFSSLLFIPKNAPFDLFDPNARRGLRLFVRRVFIMDDVGDLLPPWLRFVRGVVDSDDLPLNVSREILQDSKAVSAIKKQLTKKVLDLLDDLAATKPEDFKSFFATYGVVLKEGAGTDADYRDRIAKLLQYATTADVGTTPLEGYKSRMKEGQKSIYYLYGADRTTKADSPYLEALVKRGYEVLLMSDPVDEWVVEALGNFQGVPFENAQKAKIDDAEEASKAAEGKLAPLLTRAKDVLGDRVREVRASARLVDSPACLALPEHAVPAYMEALLRANGRPVPKTPRILELNPNHPLVEKLLARGEDGAADTASAIELLYDAAKLAEGSSIDDPSAFGRRLAEVLGKVL